MSAAEEMTLQEIAAAISLMDGDHLLCEALAHQLRSTAPNFCSKLVPRRTMTARSFPNPSSIIAAQCSVFDNWIEHGGKRPKRGEAGHYRDRFKVEIQVWTWTKADIDWNNCAWRGRAHLWSANDIKKRVKGKGMKLPKALPDDFRKEVAAMPEAMEGFRIGLPYTKDGMTLLYNDDRSLVVAREVELFSHQIDQVVIKTPFGQFDFANFKATTSKGQALSGNCFAHARMTSQPPLAKKWDATLMTNQPASSRDETGAAEG